MTIQLWQLIAGIWVTALVFFVFGATWSGMTRDDEP